MRRIQHAVDAGSVLTAFFVARKIKATVRIVESARKSVSRTASERVNTASGGRNDGHDKRTIEAVAESKSFEFSMGRAMAV